MIHHGKLLGVHLFPGGGSIRWFDKGDIAEAEALEKQEIAKFAVVEAERERIRLARLGLREVARTYSISLPETQPGRKHGRTVH